MYMATKKTTKAVPAHYSVTVGSVAKSSGFKLKQTNPRMTVAKYFESHGAPSLGKAMRAVEHTLSK